MIKLVKSIENYLSCNEHMQTAENHIKNYFAEKGLPKKCINNSIDYLKLISTRNIDLEKQIEIAVKRFKEFECKTKENGCCFITLGTCDALIQV